MRTKLETKQALVRVYPKCSGPRRHQYRLVPCTVIGEEIREACENGTLVDGRWVPGRKREVKYYRVKVNGRYRWEHAGNVEFATDN